VWLSRFKGEIPGITLIEVVVAVVIMGLTFNTVLIGLHRYQQGLTHSLLTRQATYLAEFYLTTILAQEFPNSKHCQLPIIKGTICDYAQLAHVEPLPVMQHFSAIDFNLTALQNYRVKTKIEFLAPYANQVLRADVTIFHPNIAPIQLSSLKVKRGIDAS
jgi:type II secretory pathway pseudopilin PulG